MIRRPSLSRFAVGACCLVSAAWLTAACRKPAEFVYVDDEEEQETEVVVVDEEGRESALPEGATIGVYIVDEDGNVSLQQVEVDEDGNAVLPASEGGTVIAYTPFQEDWGEDAILTSPVFTIADDQSTAAGYNASDLMIGTSGSSTKAGEDAFSFSHMLAKVVVNIIDDIGLSDLGKTRVTLLNVYTRVTVDLLKQQVSTIQIGQGDILTLLQTATSWRVSCYGIVAPHAMEEGVPFFSVNLFGDTPQTFPLPQDVTLESGSTFTFNLRLTEQGLIPDGWFITDWDNQEEEEIYTHE